MSDFTIEEYVAPAPVNEYRAKVEQLKTASDTADKQLAGKFVVPSNKIGPARRLISAAARELDRTAKYVGERKSDDGETVELTVVLTSKRVVKTGDTATDTDEPAETDEVSDNIAAALADTETAEAPKPRGGRKTAE